jgi:hypothetical protein
MKKILSVSLVALFIISLSLLVVSKTYAQTDPDPIPPSDTPSDTPPPADVPSDTPPPADVPPAPIPVLTTDQADYNPGDTANIFGNLFPSLQNFVLRIFGNSEIGNHYTDTSFTVNSDNAGSFSYAYLLDNMYRPLYTVTASTLDGEEIASTTFTDAAGAGVDVYSQCANDDGDGYTGNPGVCNWTNGDLNGSNSTYTEEDSTVQRLVISGLSNGAHTVVVEYQTTKGGKHAYDFLTNDTASETWVTDADLCSGPVTTAMPSCTSLSSNLSPSLPHDTLNTLGTDDTNQHFKIKNGTITSFGTPTLVNGSYGADSLTDIAVNFTVNTSTCADASNNGKCPVFITWGAHVSSQADWGAGSSAVNISGSPYHVKVVELDGGSTGNRDNQMAASAIVIPNTITIHKVTDPSTDTTTSFTYTTTGTGFSGFNLTGGTSNTQNVTPGSYSITESTLSGWGVTGLTCSATGTGTSATPNVGTRSVAITVGSAGGGVVDCIYTNTLQQAHLTLVKTVTNDNGGTVVATAWTLNGSGPTPISGATGSGAVTNAAVNAGTYALSETSGPSGYTAGSWTCSGGTQNSSNITLTAGQSATCTINNNDNAPSLTLNKIVVNDNGGTSLESAWTLTANGPTTISGPGAAGSTDVVSGSNFSAGTYALSESSGPSGYTPSAWTCTGGTQNGSNITLTIGQSATCTITNNDNPAHLIVIKHVINDNGGTATASNFTMTIGGVTAVGGNSFAGAENPGTDKTLSTLGAYTVTEGAMAGYTQTSASADCSGTIAQGETKTCTITNNDIAPTLTLIKTVINDNGGTATTASFQGMIDSGNVPWTIAQTTTAGAHTASETTLPTYAAGNWGGDCAANGTITLALAQNATCTITNNDIPAHLIVIKHVINDNGGAALANTFTTTISSVTTATPTAAGVESPGVDNTLTSVGAYSVDEGAHVGYVKTLSADCTGSIALGETKTCTITNDDIQPKLTLTKIVVNDNGGNAVVSDFPLFVNVTGVTSGVQNGFNAGVYTASETNLTGYTAGSWTGDCAVNGSVTLAPGDVKACTITNNDQPAHIILNKVVINNNGGTAGINDFGLTVGGNAVNSGVNSSVNSNQAIALNEAGLTGYNFVSLTGDAKCPSVLNGTVTLNEGETVTCTITNDDIPAHLIVIKHVINDNGGTAVAGDFTMNIGGVTATGGNSFAGVENPGTDKTLTSVGAYTVTEGAMTGYAESDSADCSGTIALGQTKTCTVTNNDISPKLTVTKIVINDNGGTKVVSDFPLFVNTTGVVSGVQNNFNAGSYTVSETADSGYSSVISGDCTSNGSVTLALGEVKACTITNDDIAPTLTLVKTVINDNGGTAVTTDFQGKIDGGNVPWTVAQTTSAGAHTATETNLPGYTAGNWGGDCAANGTITLALAQNATCTITNDDQQAYIIVNKTVINDNGGTAIANDFLLTVDTNAVSDEVAYAVNPGTHTAGETLLPGYSAGAWGGDCNVSASVTVALGQTKTCTITNDDIQPKLTLIKHVVNDNGGTKIVSDFPLFVNATGVTSGVQNGFNAGAYTASETNQTGYTALSWSGDCDANGNVTLAIGDTKTCEITNNDIAPKLTVTKIVINDNGGTKVVSDFPLFVNTTGVVSGVQNNFNAGSYTVSETTDSGYSSVISGDCASNGAVTLALAEVKACTITNNDIAPTLTLVKTVINNNGGTATTTSFQGMIDSGNVPWAVAQTMTAGAHTASETTLPGYTAGNWGGDCAANGTVSLALGQNKTCTITNDDQPAHLIVIKHVINDDGDVAIASDFTMHLTGSSLSTNDFAGSESGVNVTLNAGAYTANEVSSAGYAKTLSADCSGTIAVGQTKTCTITNNDIPHATRTQGFWQTHTTYTSGVFAGFSGALTIGTHSINTTSKLFAGFYASIPKTTTGSQRTALDKARMQMLQQWLAAKLNCQSFGCSAGTLTMLANAATAWATTNTSSIQSFAGQLDAYNNSNDALPISGQGSATPKVSQSTADASLSFWNVLP